MFANAAAVAGASFAVLLAAYLIYGRFLARRIFQLDDRRLTCAHTMKDGVDYLPTRTPILFGHHFASIAGLGPILGPAVAVIWGWLPALAWVLLGSVFIGAVHDLGALTLSLRFKGRSVGDVCRELIGPRARLLALLIIYFLLALAMGIFVNAISNLFLQYNPDAVIPSLGLMLVAVIFGVTMYKSRLPLWAATVVALAAFGGFILWGVERPVTTYHWFAAPETRAALEAARDAPPAADGSSYEVPYGAAAAASYLAAVGNEAAVDDLNQAVDHARLAWIGLLLGYAFIASVLPVWLLLQPRDYINSFQLYFALVTMLVGLGIAAAYGHESAHFHAEAVRTGIPGAPPMIPLLFVTVACGAISGFHSLVSSGTTVRQLNRERDALPIGYGAMLTEGALAVLVILACTAGLGAAAWTADGVYAQWQTAGSLAAQLSAVVRGGAAFLAQLGIPPRIGQTLLAVTIVAFALTTLDSGTRLLRFNVEEICRSLNLTLLANRYFGSIVAVAGVAFFGLVASPAVWTLFGATNQLLAGLALLAVSLFLYRLSRPVVYTLVPMVLMLAVSIWAMAINLRGFVASETLEPAVRLSLIGVCLAVMAMAFWLIAEGLVAFARGRGGLDLADDALPAAVEELAEPAEVG